MIGREESLKTEVLVLGGGIAGLNAAIAAREQGVFLNYSSALKLFFFQGGAGQMKFSKRLSMLALILPWAVSLAAPTWAPALEQVKVGTATKLPHYALPLWAIEEGGFDKEAGVKVAWVPFESSIILYSAVVAGDINTVLLNTSEVPMAAARQLPLVVVADLGLFQDWAVFVRKDSHIRNPTELKGARFGISRLGALNHAYAQAVAKSLGMEKDVKYASLGGIPHILAGLMSGAVDALVTTGTAMIKLELDGQVPRLLNLDVLFPIEDPKVVAATTRAVETKEQAVKGTIAALLESGRFLAANRPWAVAKMKSLTGWNDPVAEEFYRRYMKFSSDGTIRPKRLEQMRRLLMDYGVIKEQVTPPVERLYTGRFVPVLP